MPGFRYRTVATNLSDRIAAVRGTVRDGVRRVREAARDAQREAERTAQQLGLELSWPGPRKQPPVIDVGASPSLPSRFRRFALAMVAFSLLAGGVAALFLFLLQLGAAALIVTRGLGLRLDVSPPGAARQA